MRNAAEPQRPWVMLLLIWTIFMVHGVDRSVMLVLLEPIRRTFMLSDSEIGLVAGLAYAVPFALAGIPFGALADRVNRVRLLAVLLAVWSLLTGLAGLAPSFLLLLLARAGVGASEAGGPPTMLSLLTDSFDPRRRPAALSIYYTGPPIGMMVGSIAAGQLAEAHGWRSALLMVGLPGILLALVAWMLMKEPERGRYDVADGGAKAPPEPIGRALAIAWGDRDLRRLAFALVMSGFVAMAISGWVPVLLQREYGLPPGRAGILTALAIGLTMGVGAFVGGLLGSRLGRGNPVLLQRFAGYALLLAVPLAVAAPLILDVRITLILYAIWSCVGSAYMGPGWGVALARTPSHIRATIMAATLVAANLIGQGFGPQSVGVASDLLAMAGDADHLRHAMASLALVGLLPALLLIRRPAAD